MFTLEVSQVYYETAARSMAIPELTKFSQHSLKHAQFVLIVQLTQHALSWFSTTVCE